MADPSPPTPEFLADAAFFVRATQIFFCAMYAVTVWDWIISLPREYLYIWKQEWSPPKVLYIGCRYWVLIIMPVIIWINTNESHTRADCEKLYNIPPLLSMWNQLFAESVLLIRTYAFLGRKKVILVALMASLCCIVGYQLYVALLEMAPLPFVVPPFETGPCLPTVRTEGSAHILGWFLAPLIYDTIVTAMTIWYALQLQYVGRGVATSPVLQTFLREGIYYFILISIANIINAVFNIQPKRSMGALAVPLSLVFPDILACRLILDLREQALNLSLGSTVSGATTDHFIRPPYNRRRVTTEVSIMGTNSAGGTTMTAIEVPFSGSEAIAGGSKDNKDLQSILTQDVPYPSPYGTQTQQFSLDAEVSKMRQGKEPEEGSENGVNIR